MTSESVQDVAAEGVKKVRDLELGIIHICFDVKYWDAVCEMAL